MKAFALLLALLTGACTSYHLPLIEGARAEDSVDGKFALGQMHLRPTVCKGIDMTPDYEAIDEGSLVAFLKARGANVRVTKKPDLNYVEVQTSSNADDWVRLKVVVFDTPGKAGEELERAIVRDGSGTWGFHRGNVSVRAPRAEIEDVLAFIAKTKLACWGVLTIADGKEATVIPGGYREL